MDYFKDNNIVGIAYNEAIFNENGRIYDYKIIEINNVFESIFSIHKEDIVGKNFMNVIKEKNNFNLSLLEYINEIYFNKDKPPLEKYFKDIDMYYSISIFFNTPNRFTMTFIDITNNKKQLIKLEKRERTIKEKLERLEREVDIAQKSKAMFLANIGHELRTPLNSIIGFTDLLKRTDLSEKQKEYLENANSSGYSLLKIINDVLDFARIESGIMKLKLEKINIKELFMESITPLKESIKDKDIKFLINIDESIPKFAIVDSERLKLIVLNLLNNALKFTEDGEIEFRVKCKYIQKNRCNFFVSVRDTGIGISKDESKYLFKVFSQVDESTTRKFGGTGLGLITSQMIAEKMNSSIKFESKKGEGSNFFFEFEAEVYNQILDKNKDKKIYTKDKSNINILIAEDVPMNMLLAKSLIKEILPNTEIESASNGAIAIEKYRKMDFDIIFMDIQMPKIDGIEATKEIRKLEKTKNKETIIIALTAGVSEDERQAIYDAGVNDFLEKPLDNKKLFNVIYNYNMYIEKSNNKVHFDRQQLINKCGIDTTNEIIEIFKIEIPKQINQIGLAIQSKNKEEIKSFAHGLKGAAVTICLPNIELISKSLEELVINNSNWSFIEDRYSDLLDEWNNVKKEL